MSRGGGRSGRRVWGRRHGSEISLDARPRSVRLLPRKGDLEMIRIVSCALVIATSIGTAVALTFLPEPPFGDGYIPSKISDGRAETAFFNAIGKDIGSGQRCRTRSPSRDCSALPGMRRK